MNRKLLAGLAAAAVLVTGGVLWWADPFGDDRPWVPTCGGVWSLGRV